jgi:hypothetical protein
MDEDLIHVGLQVASGRDHHDYVRVFADAVALDIRAVRRAFVRIWLAEPEHGRLARQLLDEIGTAMEEARQR